MTIAEMLKQAGILTLLGMCVVFLFLVILILSMYLLHAVVHALRLDQDKKQEKEPVSAAPAPVADNGAIVAAIAAAVHEKSLN